MAIQQLSAKAWGGLNNLPSSPQPAVANWQRGGKGAAPTGGQQGMGLLDILRASMERPDQPQPEPLELGASQWQQPSWGMDAQGAGGGQPGQIRTGINAPSLPMPQAPGEHALPSWVDAGAVAANLPTQLQPQQMALQDAYYPVAADLLNSFQVGRAGAGQGWAANQQGQQNTLMQALLGLG